MLYSGGPANVFDLLNMPLSQKVKGEAYGLKSMNVITNIYMRTVNISGCVVDKFWGPINRNLKSRIKI